MWYSIYGLVDSDTFSPGAFLKLCFQGLELHKVRRFLHNSCYLHCCEDIFTRVF